MRAVEIAKEASCESYLILVWCSSTASPFVVPLWAGFVVSLGVYRLSCAQARHGGIVSIGVIFLVFHW